ncbi:acetate kinase [Blastococcus sp. TF02A-26]|uniref:acetate kinase n=1 Tax=Blastococcus sp. TF02A-26 TaxID=2250577 RepID=UPI00131454DC|nr:acetate kinase [Blastococcus sp. TF02A-26]
MPTIPAGSRRLVLSLNAGSTSLKAALRDPALRLHVDIAGLDRDEASVTVDGTGAPAERALLHGGWPAAVPEIADAVARRGLRPALVAHRIVHGSALLPAARRADDALLSRLHAEEALDPLHLPRQLAVAEEARACWPDAAVVLVPDGGFHARLPHEAVALPLPAGARAAGLRRRGSHGLAVQSVVDTLPGMASGVVVHLGSGCSVTAVEGGAPRSTTTTLSPAGGVPSLTRSGDLDPEVVLRLVDADGGSVAGVRELLTRRSGVAGLSGGRTDVRELLAADDGAADLALRVFVRDVAMAVAGAVTTLDGWDTLVFTGGIGVHSAEIRERVCARLLSLRPGTARQPGIPSERLAATGLRVLAVAVDEEAVMDRLTRAAVPG